MSSFCFEGLMIALHSQCHNENAEYATSLIVRSPVVRATVRETHWNKVLAKFHVMRKLNDDAALYLLAPNSINFSLSAVNLCTTTAISHLRQLQVRHSQTF